MSIKIKNVFELSMFLCVFLVLLHTVSYVLTPQNSDIFDVKQVSQKIKDVNREKKNTIDVIFAGDSEAYSSFCPLLMYNSSGITSYVVGTSAQNICDSSYLIKEILENQSPRVLFLETGVMFRASGDSSESGKDFVQDYCEKNIYAIKYHSRWKSLLNDYVNRKNTLSDEALQKGFRYRKNVVPYTGGAYMMKTDAVRKFPLHVNNYLDEIIKTCNENNVKLVFVSVPSPATWNMQKHNAVKKYAKENNIAYIDMNMIDLKIDWNSDTKDGGDHLNFYGACKVTAFIEKYIKQTYSFKDHRKDIGYMEWNKRARNFYDAKVAADSKACYEVLR